MLSFTATQPVQFILVQKRKKNKQTNWKRKSMQQQMQAEHEAGHGQMSDMYKQ